MQTLQSSKTCAANQKQQIKYNFVFNFMFNCFWVSAWQWLRQVAEGLTTLVWFLCSSKTFCWSSVVLRELNQSVHWHACLCSLNFSTLTHQTEVICYSDFCWAPRNSVLFCKFGAMLFTWLATQPTLGLLAPNCLQCTCWQPQHCSDESPFQGI